MARCLLPLRLTALDQRHGGDRLMGGLDGLSDLFQTMIQCFYGSKLGHSQHPRDFPVWGGGRSNAGRQHQGTSLWQGEGGERGRGQRWRSGKEEEGWKRER